MLSTAGCQLSSKRMGHHNVIVGLGESQMVRRCVCVQASSLTEMASREYCKCYYTVAFCLR